MISYSWSVQAEAKALKEKLHENGYRVWLDIENMSAYFIDYVGLNVDEYPL